MKKVYLTTHSKVRYAERSLTADADKNTDVTTAFRRGHEFSDYNEPFKSYLESKCHNGGRHVAKCLNNQVYVFENRSGHRLLTVYKVPEEYGDSEQYLIKQEDLAEAIIKLTDLETGEEFFWNEDEPTTLLTEQTLVFKNQKRAENYIKNNAELQELKEVYNIEILALK